MQRVFAAADSDCGKGPGSKSTHLRGEILLQSAQHNERDDAYGDVGCCLIQPQTVKTQGPKEHRPYSAGCTKSLQYISTEKADTARVPPMRISSTFITKEKSLPEMLFRKLGMPQATIRFSIAANELAHENALDNIVNNQATEMFDRLVKQLAEKEGITEQLKAEDQMEWVQCMNNIRNRAEEIVNAEVILM